MLTSDPEILNTVSGLSIDLVRELPTVAPLQYPLGTKEHDFVLQEISRLVEKKVIMPCQHEDGEFISPIF